MTSAADKLAAAVAKWETTKETGSCEWCNGAMWAYGQCVNDAKPILAELQRAQGRLTEEQVKPILQAWRDNWNLRSIPSRANSDLMNRILNLLSLSTPAEPKLD
jgi:hypothetical protein